MFGPLWYVFVTYGAMLATKSIKDSKLLNTVINKVAGVVFIGLGQKLMVTKPQ